MEIQYVIVYVLFAAAIGYLIWLRIKKKNKKSCGNDSCGCGL